MWRKCPTNVGGTRSEPGLGSRAVQASARRPLSPASNDQFKNDIDELRMNGILQEKSGKSLLIAAAKTD